MDCSYKVNKLRLTNIIPYTLNCKYTFFFYKAQKIKNYSFGLEELVSGYIKTNNDFDCIDKIDNLCEILDFINFETDTEEQKIKSSYQDTEHLKHAWKCKYFITNDKKLIKRGKFIYSLLNIDTEFLTISEFKEMMISQYKK